MNTGSKNAQSVGFDISYLPKLSNTKDRENKNTLLHFLVEHVERDYPELLSFADELFHLDGAAKVSVETIQKSLKQMDSNIKYVLITCFQEFCNYTANVCRDLQGLCGKSECGDFKLTGIACIPVIPVVFEVNK